MSKVIQIRDVPDEVHATLVRAAEAAGLSLTGYLQRELAGLANREAAIRHNMDVIYATQAKIGVQIDRQSIVDAIHEGREERWA